MMTKISSPAALPSSTSDGFTASGSPRVVAPSDFADPWIHLDQELVIRRNHNGAEVEIRPHPGRRASILKVILKSQFDLIQFLECRCWEVGAGVVMPLGETG